MSNSFKRKQLLDNNLDNDKRIFGRLVYGFCGGLCLAVLALFIVSLLDVEIRQKGYSTGKAVFFFIWALSIVSAYFIKNRFVVARNIFLLFALFSFSVPIIYFFKTDTSVWFNTTVLWVNITFVLLAVLSLVVFLWLTRICRQKISPECVALNTSKKNDR